MRFAYGNDMPYRLQARLECGDACKMKDAGIGYVFGVYMVRRHVTGRGAFTVVIDGGLTANVLAR